MWDLETTVVRNEKQAAAQIARLAKMFNKKPYRERILKDTSKGHVKHMYENARKKGK